MTTTDRMLLSAVLLSVLSLVGWLLHNVSLNSGRISVLEHELISLKEDQRDIKIEMREHRNRTENGFNGR